MHKDIVKKIARIHYSADFDCSNIESVKKAVEELKSYTINSTEALETYIEKKSEFDFILEEEMAWRYIRMTQYADQEKYAEAFNTFNREIISPIQNDDFKIKKKIYNSPFFNKLQEDKYSLFEKLLSNDIELFREENVELKRQERELANQYGATIAGMTVEYKGKEYTLNQLSIFLKDPNRSIREEVWKMKMDRMKKESEKLNKLYDQLKELRIQQAENAGFKNYRDYMHQSKARFDYTPEDIKGFHESVEREVVPFLKKLNENRKKSLKIETLRPWDTQVDLDGCILKPFQEIEAFAKTAIQIMTRIKPEYGYQLQLMKNSDLLDLENRKGKAPGGYNYPLMETGAPFIFMNAVGIHNDVRTLVHEAGHAMHSFATNHIRIGDYRSCPSEVAELASMSMELLSMDQWSAFYPEEKDFQKAKKDQLENCLKLFPWIMIVDEFQQWIYTHPAHTPEERSKYFQSLLTRFNTGVDWSDLESESMQQWLFQLHIFEVPFYYIEYAISQLGAIAVYQNYKNDPEKALTDYDKFLSKGYTCPINELYQSAGIRFNFSADYIRSLVGFISNELKKLEKA